MYRLNDIVNSFLPLVGWEEQGESLSENNTTSESGLYFQEAHPLLTLRALKGVMPEGEELDDYLKELEVRGIKKVITRFVRDKVIGVESKNLLDHRCLFDGTGRIANRTPPTNKIVGFEITPLRSKGVVLKVDKIGLQFYGNTGSITLYLFHSSHVEPIATKTVEYNNANGTFMWVDVEDWYLPYVNSNIAAGGSWYLAYDQASLPPYMESVNFGRDWTREPCGTCNKGDAQMWRLMTRYVQFSPFYVVPQGEWDGALWDIGDMMYVGGDNFGLNVMFSIGCDVTDSMVAGRMDFANAIQLQVAAEALRTIALNPEVAVNRVQYNVDRDNILYETDGNGQGIKGLHGDLERAYKALSFDTKGLDDVCLTCKSKGLKFGTI